MAIKLSPVHTKPEEFENGSFTLTMHQTVAWGKDTTITGHFGFLFEENSVREIT